MTTAELHLNSVLSTPKVQYMCLNIGNFYLTATPNQYEYMKMPISLLPPCIIIQYNRNSKVVGGYIYLQMCKATWGLPQAGILASTSSCGNVSPQMVITNAKTLPASGNTQCGQSRSPWLSTVLAKSMSNMRTSTISLRRSKPNMFSLRIGRVISPAASNLIGITTNGPSTF